MLEDGQASLDYLLEFQELAASVEHLKRLFANVTNSSECEMPDVFVSEINQALESFLQEFADVERENFDFILQSSQKLRQVAGGLSGAYQMLKTTPLSLEQQNYVNFVSMGVSGLMSVIDELLLFIQYQTGKVSEKRHTFQILPLVEEIAAYYHARTRGSRVGVAFNFGKSMPKEVIGDSDKLRQILNTVLNLSTYATYEGEIRISVSWNDQKNHSLTIVVEDSGEMLEKPNSKEIQEEVFSASPTQETDTVLSLRLCRKIVTLLGGLFHLESNKNGNRFELQLNFTQKSQEKLGDTFQKVGIRAIYCIGSSSIEFESLQNSVASLGFALHRMRDLSEFEEYLANSYLNDKDCVIVLDSWASCSDRMLRAIQTVEPQRRPFCVYVGENGEIEKLGDITDYGFFDKIAFPVFPTKVEAMLLRVEALSGNTNLADDDADSVQYEALSPDFNRVLIIDDNRFNAYVIEKLVRKIGCSATIACDGISALELLKSSDFDIVLMDCIMPGLSGFETAKRIRSGGNNSDVPIIAITANNDQETRRKCFQSGMNDFLNKPVHLNLLAESINRWGGESILPISADGMDLLEFSQKSLGLKNESYRGICELFCEIIDLWKVELIEALFSQNTSLFCQHCYYLRSSLSLFGLEESFLLIRDLEEQAKSGKWMNIDSGSKELKVHLDNAISLCQHRVKTSGSDIQETSSFDTVEVKSSLDVLKDSLVLILDSDPLVLRIFQDFEEYGLRLLSARTVNEAETLLDRIEIASISCVVCSDNCDDLDPLSFLKYARNLDEQISCIVYAHRPQKMLVNEALKLGAVEVVSKPSALSELTSSLADAVVKTRRNQSLIATREAAEKMGSSQLNLLSSSFSPQETHLTEVVYHPQQEAGGDFFVKYQLDNGNWLALLTDVSGHDLDSAYVSAYFHGMVRGFVSSGNQTVCGALESFNSFLLNEWNNDDDSIGYVERSIAVDALELIPSTKEVNFYLAGGCIPCAVDRNGGARFVNEKTGTPLGWFDTPLVEKASFSTEELGFVFLWSDGVEEVAQTVQVNRLAVVSSLLFHEERNEKPVWINECNDDLLVIRFSEPASIVSSDIFPVFIETFQGNDGAGIDEIQQMLRASLLFLWNTLPDELLHDLLFCCREALINGFKHGCNNTESGNVFFSFVYDRKKELFICEVEDDGAGFDVERVLLKEKEERFHCGTNMIQVMTQSCRYQNNGRKLTMHFDASNLAE